MMYRLLISIILGISLISCSADKNTNNKNLKGDISNATVEDSKTIEIDVEDVKIIDIDSDYQRLLYRLWDNTRYDIEGYYYMGGEGIVGYSNYIVYITIENDDLVIFRFNIINNDNIYEEIMRFNMYDSVDVNTFMSSIIFKNGDYKIEVRFLSNGKHDMIISKYYSSAQEYLRAFNFGNQISTEVNDELIKHTTDYQRQYTGIYKYDSHAIIGLTFEENRNTYFGKETDEIESYKEQFYIISVNDDGFIFANDRTGNSISGYGGTQIIDENEEGTLFWHPVEGFPVGNNTSLEGIKIYFFDNSIFYELYCLYYYTDEEGYRETIDYSIQFIYRRK
jgi:hypothetical protein